MKEIVYGMPDIESFDFDKYEIGGCTDMDTGATHWCVDCSKGFRRRVRKIFSGDNKFCVRVLLRQKIA